MKNVERHCLEKKVFDRLAFLYVIRYGKILVRRVGSYLQFPMEYARYMKIVQYVWAVVILQ